MMARVGAEFTEVVDKVEDLAGEFKDDIKGSLNKFDVGKTIVEKCENIGREEEETNISLKDNPQIMKIEESENVTGETIGE